MSNGPEERSPFLTLLSQWDHDAVVTGHEHVRHNVGIVGGGLGGLTAARILQTKGHTVTVFESEPSPTARLQGGSLDMHTESGQRALELAGLTTEFRRLARPEGNEMKIVNKEGVVFYEETGPLDGGGQGPSPGHDRPEVDRGQLRQILLDSLEPDTVKWNHVVQSVEIVQGGSKVQVHFEQKGNSKTETDQESIFDFVVGADGTWSRVRPLLSSAKPTYAGVTFVEFNLSHVDEEFPSIAQLVGQGTFSALGDDKGIIAQRSSGSHVKIYVALRVPVSWPIESGIESLLPAHAAEFLLSSYFADWSPSIREFLTPDPATPSRSLPIRPFFVLPSTHTWPADIAKGRVTLIGDAAHVMTPFAGEGANLAMIDGAELALTLASCRDGVMFAERIPEFERNMLARSKAAAEESLRNLDIFICKDAPAPAADLMKKLMSGGPPS